MQLIKWTPVGRKRNKTIRYTDPEYIRGYDIDIVDFSELVDKYNENKLTSTEENRLLDHVLTMIQIVTENPDINPRPGELDELTDVMFMDAWGALRYIKPKKNPYSYIYRSAYTGACTRYYKKKITERTKSEAIERHCREVFDQYNDSISDHKVRCTND